VSSLKYSPYDAYEYLVNLVSASASVHPQSRVGDEEEARESDVQNSNHCKTFSFIFYSFKIFVCKSAI
jgi:hypothetical protein